MPDSVLYRVGLSLAVAGRPGARRRAVIEPGLEPLPAGWEDAAQAEMEAARRLGIAILVPDDPRFPPLLREVPDPPLVLYVRGGLEPDDRLAVAVVGSRRSTPWGTTTAKSLGADLAARGFTVVSGMARGIDAAAHRGALATEGGRTLAVLGSGLDRIYPPEHERLAESIAKHGALLSELPLGTPPLPRHFPERNRLIAWMAWATVVVEAARDSGSLITAGLAADAGRLVFAMPGPAGEPNAAGTSALLRDGAICCRDAQDVAEDLEPQVGDVAARIVAGRTRVASPIGAAGSEAEARSDARASDMPPMSDAERRVLERLSPARGTGIETLVSACGLPAGALMSALLELELRGLVRQVPGPRFIISKPHERPK